MFQPQIRLSRLHVPHPTEQQLKNDTLMSSFSQSSISADSECEIFPNCSTQDVEEINSILTSLKRTKEDLQFLYEKLKDIAIFHTIIKKLNLDDNQETLFALFGLLRIEEYEPKSVVYSQGSSTNSSAYILLRGAAYKFDDPASKSPQDLKNRLQRKSIFRQVSGLESKNHIPDPEPPCVENVQNEPRMTPMAPNIDIKLVIDKEMDLMLDMEDDGENQAPVTVRDQRENVKRGQSQVHKPRRSQINTLERLYEALSTNFDNTEEKPEELSPGDHFGQKALWSMQRRDHTIITKTRCEVIVLTAEAFRTIKRTAKTNKKKMFEFMSTCFPSLSSLVNDDMVYHSLVNSTFTKQTFSNNHSILTEGQIGSNFYIVYEGECELLKKVVINNINETGLISPNNTRKSLLNAQLASVDNISIVSLKEGTFFGEELFFSEHKKYAYTVKVTSPEAKVLFIDTANFLTRFPKATVLELKDCFYQKQKKNCEILSQNLLLRGYALDEQAFLEQNKVILGPQKESKFRSFYSYQTKIIKENPSPVSTPSQVLLQNVRERIDAQYAHKLRLNRPYSSKKSPRLEAPTMTPTLSRLYTPEVAELEGRSYESFSPNPPEDSPNSYISSPGKSLRVIKTVIDNNNKRLDSNCSPSQFFLANSTEKTKKLTASPSSPEKVETRRRPSQIIIKTEPEEEPRPLRLKFLRPAEPKKSDPKSGLRKFLDAKVPSSSKKQTNAESLRSASPRTTSYAELVKIRYRSKFAEVNESNDGAFEYNKSAMNNSKAAEDKVVVSKNKEQIHSFDSPLLGHGKTSFKISAVNIHIRNDKKKVTQMQRRINRVDVGCRTEF